MPHWHSDEACLIHKLLSVYIFEEVRRDNSRDPCCSFIVTPCRGAVSVPGVLLAGPQADFADYTGEFLHVNIKYRVN